MTGSINEFVKKLEVRIDNAKNGASIIRYTNDKPPATATTIASMTDEELAELVRKSRSIRLPRFLNDGENITQRFVYTARLNSKPIVLHKEQFQQFLHDNNIPKKQIMTRRLRPSTISSKEIADMFKYNDYNYIGGKKGGTGIGCGAYFAMNGGADSIYGQWFCFRSKYNGKYNIHIPGNRVGSFLKDRGIKVNKYDPGATIIAAYNPSKARIIGYKELCEKAIEFEKSHPLFAKEIGPMHGFFLSPQDDNISIYALAMGYNAIQNSYKPYEYQIIDRSAVVCQVEEEL
jgi:hypothetical protein